MNATESTSILITDDENNIRMMLRTALESEGYEIREASNGRAALDSLIKQPADLMLLDLNMPELDGMEVLSQMKSVLPTEQPKVIVLTAYGSIPTAVKAVQLGAADFIEKPVSPSDLRDIVRSVLEEPSMNNVAIPIELTEGYGKVVSRIRKSLKVADTTSAETLLTKLADRRNEKAAEYFNLLGALYETQGNWRLARKCYGKGMSADRRYAPAEANMRRFYELYTFGHTKQSIVLGDEPEFASNPPQL